MAVLLFRRRKFESNEPNQEASTGHLRKIDLTQLRTGSHDGVLRILLRASSNTQIPDFRIDALDPTTDKINREIWRIDSTITELSYLSHNFFRYYGKFPSVLARRLIDRYTEPGNIVLDNMAGCGTTLVEAMLLGRHSIGLDINPLAVLSGKVKTASARHLEFEKLWNTLSMRVQATTAQQLFSEPQIEFEQYVPTRANIDKWFSAENVSSLATLRALIETQEDAEFKEFVLLALAAIVRRVSKAYDGEVRPHVNPDKRIRPVIPAFISKVNDMLARLRQQDQEIARPMATSTSILCDARELQFETIGTKVDLAISHPPYLNCFNYIPIYNWEMEWLGINPRNHSGDELISWPARPEIAEAYYEGNQKIIAATAKVLKSGGRSCIVIGDCTIGGVLERTHAKFIELGQASGLELESIIYRDTHYATGRYAYNHRAEYNYESGEQTEKRDVILVFVKP